MGFAEERLVLLGFLLEPGTGASREKHCSEDPLWSLRVIGSELGFLLVGDKCPSKHKDILVFTSLIPGSGRSTGEGIVYPLQYSWASLVAQLV